MPTTQSQRKGAKKAVPEKPKPPNKADAKVPYPNVLKLNGPAGSSHAHRSRVHLGDFLKRGKNTKEGKRLAEEQAGRMSNWEADAGSMIVCGEDGEVLLCVFAWCFGRKVLRKKGNKIDFKNVLFYPGPEGQTLADIVEKDILSTDGKEVLQRKTYYDGFKEAQIHDYHVVLQEVSALVDPIASNRDMHHPDDMFMPYPAERGGVYPNSFTMYFTFPQDSCRTPVGLVEFQWNSSELLPKESKMFSSVHELLLN
ncbi:hypothetical protein DFP72DRAFT_1060791 [Ephemerocybe angulata]|uniref:Uncharacterized protein n=1 Tax=Ephemerocybe angulata TaxID=980116 RepID=A0A8H6ICG2_9AGAR|nr:hypothetical protein DFP72DRAFT_1060791 [Tulosesus angulatus]